MSQWQLLAIAVCAVTFMLAGQAEADWGEAENLGPTINSSYNDWYPVLARDGSFMIFVSTRPGGVGQSDLWISRYVDGQWQTPQNLGPNANSVRDESAPYLSVGDDTLYFASFAAGGYGGMDIWYCPLEDGIPGPRVNLGPTINGGALECCPVISTDGNTLYLCSDRAGTTGSMDAWVSHRVGGEWTVPENLGPVVNSTATDCPRWLSDDGQTLILASTRPGGYGSADMWYTERSGEEWGELVNLGPNVNCASADWGPGFLGNAGAMAGIIFFGSGRLGGHGGWDLWRCVSDPCPVPAVKPEPSTPLLVYPNPAVSTATISYNVSEPAYVRIRLYDVKGRFLRSLVDKLQEPGIYQTVWDGTIEGGTEMTSGVCYCRMQMGRQETTRRFVYSKE